ncbi:hypothetical protein GCM10007898_45670 [Dyella flagellata]|uniref:Uncharacterized protein n=1 Tax=Dyella flagellata TaxID=1867833 RepID=A0ABQ5XII1_9GAMM|nr:hypothetical protein GCM10007898_45670 [Dyella flagellata]
MTDRLHRVVGIAALGHHLEVGLHFNEPFEPLADYGVIVDQNNAVHGGTVANQRAVIPAKAVIHVALMQKAKMDSRFHGNDGSQKGPRGVPGNG